MIHRKTKGSVSNQTLFGIIILVVLGMIAGVILITQARYKEDFFQNTITQEGNIAAETSSTEQSSGLSISAPDGFKYMGNAEVFDPDTLSEKINGKAELYLDCGFQELFCQRFSGEDNPEEWFELYLYDMEKPDQAFAVYSQQRRQNAEKSEFSPLCYTTENALFLMTGKYYVEIVASQASNALSEALAETARGILGIHPSEPFIPGELSYLPRENRKKDTEKYFLKNAFSYERMDHLLTVNYSVSGKDITAFISIRQTPEEAQSLKKAYHQFLMNLGADNLSKPEIAIPGILMADVVGDKELMFSEGSIFAGIHAVPDMKLAQQLIVKIFEHIREKQ